MFHAEVGLCDERRGVPCNISGAREESVVTEGVQSMRHITCSYSFDISERGTLTLVCNGGA